MSNTCSARKDGPWDMQSEVRHGSRMTAALGRALLALLLGGALLLLGCFNPHVNEGGFACGPGGACPSGQQCYSGSCWSAPPPAGRDSGLDSLTTDLSSLGDPADGHPEAEDPAPPTPRVRALGETCGPMNVGFANRSDDCASGLVCVQGTFGATCFALCAPGETRFIDPGGPTAAVCALAESPCDPIAKTGCPVERTCYVSGGSTICETQSGDGARQTACTYPRDCLPGLTCATGPGAGYCQTVCSAAAGCARGTCQITAGATFGYCI